MDVLGVDNAGHPRKEREAKAVLNDFNDWFSERPEGPWLSWLHFFDAHYPYAPPEPFLSDYSSLPYMGEIAYLDHTVGG